MEKKKGHVLMSVFDKTGISKFAKVLNGLGYEIIASEGTGRELYRQNISFIPVSKVSGNPKELNDCIKTISFRTLTGIIFDRLNPIHIKETKKLGIKPIDIVVCNFPPIKKVIENPSINFGINTIDVGGPTMVRAAATNFKYVTVVIDPGDYEKVDKALIKNEITEETRRWLSAKAFAYISSYDSQINRYLRKI